MGDVPSPVVRSRKVLRQGTIQPWDFGRCRESSEKVVMFRRLELEGLV